MFYLQLLLIWFKKINIIIMLKTKHATFRPVPVPVYHEKYPFGGSDTSSAAPFEMRENIEPETEYRPHPQKVYSSSITIQAPASFKPIPIQQQTEAPKPEPLTVPPKPFKDTHVFQNVDTHAVEVSDICCH